MFLVASESLPAMSHWEVDVEFAALSNVVEVYLELFDKNNFHLNYGSDSESFPVEDDNFKNHIWITSTIQLFINKIEISKNFTWKTPLLE